MLLNFLMLHVSPWSPVSSLKAGPSGAQIHPSHWSKLHQQSLGGSTQTSREDLAALTLSRWFISYKFFSFMGHEPYNGTPSDSTLFLPQSRQSNSVLYDKGIWNLLIIDYEVYSLLKHIRIFSYLWNNKLWESIINKSQKSNFKTNTGDFPGSPVVKTLHFHCRGHGFDPWWGN